MAPSSAGSVKYVWFPPTTARFCTTRLRPSGWFAPVSVADGVISAVTSSWVMRPTRSNFAATTFVDTRLALLFMTDVEHRVVLALAFDADDGVFVDLPEPFADAARVPPQLLRHEQPQSRVRGLLLVGGRPMLVASAPIVTSRKEGPIRGAVVLGRYLDERQRHRLEAATLTSIALRPVTGQPPNAETLDDSFRVAFDALQSGRQVFVEPVSESRIEGYAVLKDINEQAALVLRVDRAGSTSTFRPSRYRVHSPRGSVATPP